MHLKWTVELDGSIGKVLAIQLGGPARHRSSSLESQLLRGRDERSLGLQVGMAQASKRACSEYKVNGVWRGITQRLSSGIHMHEHTCTHILK